MERELRMCHKQVRTMLARHLLIVVALLLNTCAFQYSNSFTGWTEIAIKCPRDESVGADARLIVLDHWMEHNALYVNLKIENCGKTDFIIPTKNTEINNFTAELLNSKSESVSFCGGVRMFDESAFQVDLPTEEDFHLLHSGESVELGSVLVAPFWSYVWDNWDNEYDLRSFRVYYSFVEPEIKIPNSQKETLMPMIKRTRQHYCTILRKGLASDAVTLDKGRYTPEKQRKD